MERGKGGEGDIERIQTIQTIQTIQRTNTAPGEECQRESRDTRVHEASYRL